MTAEESKDTAKADETISESAGDSWGKWAGDNWQDLALAGVGALGITALTNFVTSFISDPEERGFFGTIGFGIVLPLAALVGAGLILLNARPAEKVGNWMNDDITRTTLSDGRVVFKAKEGGDITNEEFEKFYNSLPDKNRPQNGTEIVFDDAAETVTLPKGYELPEASFVLLKKAAAAQTPKTQ